MGQPKLLLPLAGRPVIEHVLDQWTSSSVGRTIVVVRADDLPLLEHCRKFDVDALALSDDPPDMKASVQAALRHIAGRYGPGPEDAWLLAPADLPRMTARVIDAVLRAYEPAEAVGAVAVHQGRRGHPLLAPWQWAPRVHRLAADEGVDALQRRLPFREVAVSEAPAFEDLDCREDYARLAGLCGWSHPAGDLSAVGAK
jgi:molybdenum cofactor cytidylyltransferase